MKRLLVISLTILSLLALDSSAEAGRRKERRGARKGGGVYAGAYQKRPSQSYAAAPVYVAIPTPVASPPQPTIAAVADLTITEIAAVGDVLAFTVKNIGSVASPETRLDVALIQHSYAGQFESQNVRVVPLLPNQSVRIRIHSMPLSNVEAHALVDPDHLVDESNEHNNNLKVTLAAEMATAEPPTLTEESA